MIIETRGDDFVKEICGIASSEHRSLFDLAVLFIRIRVNASHFTMIAT
jgi:hypothetical protein